MNAMTETSEAFHHLNETDESIHADREVLAELDELGGFALIDEDDLRRQDEVQKREERRYIDLLERFDGI